MSETKEPKPEVVLEKVPVPELHDGGDVLLLKKALSESLSYYRRISPTTEFNFGGETVSGTELVTALAEMHQALETFGLSKDFLLYIERNFDFYKAPVEKTLVTGYFQSVLKASKVKSPPYIHPIYKVPKDLLKVDLKSFFPERSDLPRRLSARLVDQNKVVPYYDRESIDYKKTIVGNDSVLAWVADPLALFFLHIQGSGVLQFKNGETMQIGYADANGHPYRPVGKLLIDDGSLLREAVSMQTIIAYLKEHPYREREILSYNPSYVFFKQTPKGPFGSIGVQVTPRRSIATDRKLFPKGVPVFLRSHAADGSNKFEGFVFNQDTGGAITGNDHIDLFTGQGAEAESLAGAMKHKGDVYFLKPKVALNPVSHGEMVQ